MTYVVDEDKILDYLHSISKYIKIIEKKNISKFNARDNLNEDEEFNYLGVSMAIFTIQNKMIELSEELIDSLEKGYVPQSYAELPKILLKENIINTSQEKILRSFFSYRNEIAHEYDEISTPEINWCLNQLEFVKKFQRIIKERLLEN